MSKTKRKPLTGLELEIMNVVWDLDSGTVRDVYEVLRKRRKLAYTTVMTMMTILEDKGHLRRRKEGRAYRYSPAQPRNKVISGMVDEFLGRVFDGSARPLLVSLLRDNKLTGEDLEEIGRMIEEADE